MTEILDEKVDVLASFKILEGGRILVRPEIINRGSRRYKVDKLGLRYPTSSGKRTIHVFAVLCGNTALELEFDSILLIWKLTKISDDDF